MSVLDTLTNDLDWRETEIASMRLLLLSGSISPCQHTVLLRAAWAMLYAHYEGFCKNALATFFDAATGTGVLNSDLPKPTKALALGATFRRLRKLPDFEFIDELEIFSPTYLKATPEFPDVDTQSNLWPNVLIDLLESADLCSDKVKEHKAKLSTLVARRNNIAHGENNIISEFAYYKSYEDAVYDVIYDLAYQVEARLRRQPYGLAT